MFVAVVALVVTSTLIAYGLALWSSAVAQLRAESTAMAAALAELPDGPVTTRTVEGLVISTGALEIRLVDVDLDTVAVAVAQGAPPPDAEAEVDNRLLSAAMNSQHPATHYAGGAVKFAVPVWN